MRDTDGHLNAHSVSFRASFLGSTLFLGVSVLLLIWSIAVVWFTDAPELLDAIAIILLAACIIVGLVMIYRMIWRPVMVQVDENGIYLKTYNAVVPWSALEGARLTTFSPKNASKPKQLVELVPTDPLHPELKRPVFDKGRTLNQMAGLPELCISMDGIEGSNAMLLAAISLYAKILPAS